MARLHQRLCPAPYSQPFTNSASMAVQEEPLITAITVYSLLGVIALLAAAQFTGARVLPKNTRGVDVAIFTWLYAQGRESKVNTDGVRSVFDGLVHFIFEGAFLYTRYVYSRSARRTAC